jgi:hypothetical protein
LAKELLTAPAGQPERSINKMKPIDDGYISKYLIHWAGKGTDHGRADVLSVIASTCELLLSYNRIHSFDWSHEIHEKMTCFTDVPLAHSHKHCSRYSKFRIAFHKLKLMNVGAQPVFYVSHATKQDMHIIFKFIQEQTRQLTMEPGLFKALHRHFYFMQRLSDGRADGNDTYYYEREWRLGAQSLPTAEEWDRPNPRYHCQQEGYTRYIGKRVIRDGKEYFSFKTEDVAFLVAPRAWMSRIQNPKSFNLFAFEDLVQGPDKIMIEQSDAPDGRQA